MKWFIRPWYTSFSRRLIWTFCLEQFSVNVMSLRTFKFKLKLLGTFQSSLGFIRIHEKGQAICLHSLQLKVEMIRRKMNCVFLLIIFDICWSFQRTILFHGFSNCSDGNNPIQFNGNVSYLERNHYGVNGDITIREFSTGRMEVKYFKISILQKKWQEMCFSLLFFFRSVSSHHKAVQFREN